MREISLNPAGSVDNGSLKSLGIRALQGAALDTPSLYKGRKRSHDDIGMLSPAFMSKAL